MCINRERKPEVIDARLHRVMCCFSEFFLAKSTMDRDDTFDRTRILNLFAFLIESISLYTQSFVRQYSQIIRRFLENFQIAELFDALSERVAEHPFLKYVVFATALSCAIPVVMFIMFGITSMVITFAGFLFIEGTLLIVGGLCMFICIVSLILVLSLLGLTAGIFYILASKLQHVLSRFQTNSNILSNYNLLNGRVRNDFPNMIDHHD